MTHISTVAVAAESLTRRQSVQDPGRVRYLDGLRGLAAVIVFIAHLFLIVFPALFNGLASMARLRFEGMLAGTPLDLLWAANFAVCIFFVMSALVLANYFQVERPDFLTACIRRYVRLTIPIFASCLLAYVLWITVGMHNLEAQQITQEGWLKSFYLSYPGVQPLLAEPFFGVYQVSNSVLNPVLWTMKYELQGSLGVFLLYALFPSRQVRSLIALIAIYVFFRSYYLCFAGGVLLFEWSRRSGERNAGFQQKTGWICLLLGAYMGAFPYNVAEPQNFWFGRMLFLDVETWHMIGAIPCVFGVMCLPKVQRFLSRGVFQFLGKISFSLYLVHVPLIGSVTTSLIVALYRAPHARFAMFAAAALTFPVVFGFAYLFYRYVDVPAIQLSRRVAAWIAGFLGEAAREAGSDRKGVHAPEDDAAPAGAATP